MGSCISKCKRKRKRQEESNHVQDKLVISQAPAPPPPPPPPPLPSAHSHSPTLTSLSCTNASGGGSSLVFSSSSSSSSSSCSYSSTISSKERSFSNEFLWSCVKENPQIIRIDPIKGNGNTHAKKLEPPAKINAVPVKQPTPPRHGGGTPRKRARANSPAPAPLSRQRSFRREPEWLSSPPSVPSRTPIRPPSPGRRLAGLSSAKKENIRPSSPNNILSRHRPCLVKKETFTHRIGSKMEEAAAGESASGRDIGDIAAEDIDNPLIALDCFIFL